MDFLAAEIARKRKELSSFTASSPSKKYLRQSDLEAQRQAAYKEEQEKLALERDAKINIKLAETRAREAKALAAKEAQQSKTEEEKAAGWDISEEDVFKRLRAKGQPIQLFGETENERKVRLRAVELIEERSEGQRNELMKTLKDMEGKMDLAALRKKADELDAQAGKAVSQSVEKYKGEEGWKIHRKDIKGDIEKVYRQLYAYFKLMCQEWEKAMDERSVDVKHSQQGKIAAANQQQSVEYLKPFFRRLKKRDLESDVFPLIAEIAYQAQHREYMKANDAYYKLSIGNAAWPIGVTMVGIHERSAREKLHSVAHVLNDESTRKWLQSLKRWLSFAQVKWPPADRRSMMG